MKKDTELEKIYELLDDLTAILSNQLDALQENKITARQCNAVTKAVGKFLTRFRRELKETGWALPEVIERRKKLLDDCRDFLREWRGRTGSVPLTEEKRALIASCESGIASIQSNTQEVRERIARGEA